MTVCQDRNIRLYSVAGAKQTKTFKGSASEDGTLIKVVLDRSGIYCATSCSDKTLAIYDYSIIITSCVFRSCWTSRFHKVR